MDAETHHRMPWSTPRVKMMAKLLAKGFSFSEVADMLRIGTGHAFTRNAVAGKAWREGLCEALPGLTTGSYR